MSSSHVESNEVMELLSSPSDTTDFSIVNVETVEPVRLDDDDGIIEISSNATPHLVNSSFSPSHSQTQVPSSNRRNSGGDDLEITSVEMHPQRPPLYRNILNLPGGNMSFVLPEPMSRTPTPPRTIFNNRRSSARLRTNNNDRNRMRDVLIPRFHAVQGALYQFFAGLQSREEDDLQRALRLSAQQYYFAYQGTDNSPNIEDARTLPVPKEVRPGFTRTIDPANTYQCAWCQVELNEGIPECTKTNKQSWLKSFNGITDVDRQMSKRIFFSGCGHVYCGWCVKRIVNRPKTRSKKKPRRDLELANSQYIASCCVDNCRKPFRGKFIEIFS